MHCFMTIVLLHQFNLRLMEFKVLTTVLPRADNTTSTNIYYEPVSDSYAIDLSHYRYVVVSTIYNNDDITHNITSEGFVHDLPGFHYINQDCETIALSNNSRWVSLFTTLTITICFISHFCVFLNFLFAFIHFFLIHS